MYRQKNQHTIKWNCKKYLVNIREGATRKKIDWTNRK